MRARSHAICIPLHLSLEDNPDANKSVAEVRAGIFLIEFARLTRSRYLRHHEYVASLSLFLSLTLSRTRESPCAHMPAGIR